MVLANQISGFQIKHSSRTKGLDSLLFYMLIPELIEKYSGGCGQNWLQPPWSQSGWMNELS